MGRKGRSRPGRRLRPSYPQAHTADVCHTAGGAEHGVESATQDHRCRWSAVASGPLQDASGLSGLRHAAISVRSPVLLGVLAAASSGGWPGRVGCGTRATEQRKGEDGTGRRHRPRQGGGEIPERPGAGLGSRRLASAVSASAGPRTTRRHHGRDWAQHDVGVGHSHGAADPASPPLDGLLSAASYEGQFRSPAVRHYDTMISSPGRRYRY
jgi:hypothetical protein